MMRMPSRPPSSPPSSDPTGGSPFASRPSLIVLATTLVYGALHLIWYWQTPLGQIPVLDERENLQLAAHIAAGSLPAEPFYRMLGYPLLLSFGYRLGVPADTMPLVATGLGLLLHLGNTLLVARLAHRLFRSPRAGLLAGLLHGLNPALIHYATQILDGTYATTFVLLGMVALMTTRQSNEPPPPAMSVVACVCWSIATLIRPQFLLLFLAFPAIWWVLFRRSTTGRQTATILGASLAIGVIPWLIQGFAQKSVSGEFRLMPTQGTYNLWSANRPGAHGAYHTQQVHLSDVEEGHRNPTQVESELLFARDIGRPAESMDELNTHWSRQLRAHLTSAPLSWLTLTGRKVYLLLNHAEQYNNKTFAFHRARSPFLRFNPLGWGLIFIASGMGIAVLWKTNPSAAQGLLIILGVTAGGVVIGFVSGRFRAPLMAEATVLAGGLALVPTWGRKRIPQSRRAILLGGGIVLATGLLTFSNFADARSTRTYLQDHLLLMSSALTSGQDHVAWTEAGAALARDHSHPDALSGRITAYFNLLLLDQANPANEPAWLETAHRINEHPELQISTAARTLAALALWRAGEREEAVFTWRKLAASGLDPIPLAALAIVGETSPAELAQFLHATETPPPDAIIQMARSLQPGGQNLTATPLTAIARRLFKLR